jgi:catechol 2,3-dioxygenase-like lactoylglutathione lyase family enzyme
VHLVLAVSDVDRAEQFYDDAFGWKPHLEWPGEYAELQLPDNDWLGLYREDGFAETAGAPVDELKQGVTRAPSCTSRSAMSKKR